MIIQELTPQLMPGVRTRIGEEIAIPIAAREPLDPTRFLERVLVLRLKD